MTNFEYNMNIISALSDTPNDTEGLTAQQLKEKFDEGGIQLKAFINGTLIPEIIISVAQKGDMSSLIYDTNGDGIVNHADLADRATNAVNAESAVKATEDKEGNDITTEYAKADHTHSPADIGAAPAEHTHTASQITGMRNIVKGSNESPTISDIPNDGDIYLVV